MKPKNKNSTNIKWQKHVKLFIVLIILLLKLEMKLKPENMKIKGNSKY